MNPNQKENIAEQRRQLAGIIARDGEKERELLSQTSRLRSAICDLEQQDQGLSVAPDSSKGALVAAQKGRDARHAKIATMKSELARLDPELSMVSAGLGVAHRALGAIEEKINAERRLKISQAIAAAIAQAPSRQAFHDARAKFGDLHKRLETTEQELHILETTAREPAKVEDRAAELLATGTMPPSGPVVDGSVQRSKLLSESRTLAAAIRLQEGRVSQAGRQFADELGAALRPTMGDIARRIAGGVESARLATQECLWIETAVAVASGGESLPSVRYPGIQAPMDVADGFMFWLTRIRLSGFEV